MVSLNPFSWLRKWPISILVWELRGDQLRISKDRGGRVVNKSGVDELIFESKKRWKESMPAPPYEDYDMDDKGNTTLQLLSTAAGQYVPVKAKLSAESINLFVANTNVNEWAALKRRETHQLFKHKEPWYVTLIPYIMLMVVAASMAVMGIIMFQKAPEVLAQLGTVADKIAVAAQAIAGHTTTTATTGITAAATTPLPVVGK